MKSAQRELYLVLKTYETTMQVSISHKQEVTELSAFSWALDIFAINIVYNGSVTMLQCIDHAYHKCCASFTQGSLRMNS